MVFIFTSKAPNNLRTDKGHEAGLGTTSQVRPLLLQATLSHHPSHQPISLHLTTMHVAHLNRVLLGSLTAALVRNLPLAFRLHLFLASLSPFALVLSCSLKSMPPSPVLPPFFMDIDSNHILSEPSFCCFKSQALLVSFGKSSF